MAYTNDELYNENQQWRSGILCPDSGGDSLNNIYSIQLLFVGKNYVKNSQHGTDYPGFSIPNNFQINDISIIYRAKSAK